MHIIYFSFMFLAYAPRAALLCRGSARSRGACPAGVCVCNAARAAVSLKAICASARC